MYWQLLNYVSGKHLLLRDELEAARRIRSKLPAEADGYNPDDVKSLTGNSGLDPSN